MEFFSTIKVPIILYNLYAPPHSPHSLTHFTLCTTHHTHTHTHTLSVCFVIFSVKYLSIKCEEEKKLFPIRRMEGGGGGGYLMCRVKVASKI